MPNQTESSSSTRTAVKSSASRQPLAAKAARKRVILNEESNSGSLSDGRSSAVTRGSQDDDSDSDALQRHLNQAAGGCRQPHSITKTSKKVAFSVQDDSGSDDGTVRADPSDQHRGHRSLPTKSGAFFLQPPPQAYTPAKQSGRGAQQPWGSATNPLDNADIRPTKSVHRYRLSRVELMSWTGKFARKEFEGGGRRYSRMSIGGAGSSRPSETSDATNTQRKHARWYVRDGTVVSRSTGSDSSEGSNDEDPYGSLRPRIAKAARKFQVGIKSVRQPPSPKQAAHEIVIGDRVGYQALDRPGDVTDEPAYESSAAAISESDHEEHTEPTEALLQALERISLSSVRLQKMRRLPFLRRNLREGFEHRCQLAGVYTKHHSLPQTSISVTYHYQLTTTTLGYPGEATTASAKSSMKGWLCPLCDLHKDFANPMMLDKHLAWDHPSAKALWNENHGVLSLTILPRAPEPSIRQTYQLPATEPSKAASDFSSNATHIVRTKDAELADDKVFDHASATPSVGTTESTFVTTTDSSIEEDIKPKYSPSRYSSRTTDSWRRSDSVSGRPPSQGPLGTEARLSSDILGPSATFPYLPESNEKGDVYYSCRPGGPRLYDILNTLSLKPYGVLEWVIVDREEELFELDDILDEDKVMQALWFRWIFLNRNRFVANYFNGTKAFVTENWQLIKRGAGLLALRAWLLVLCVNNFLLPLEVVTIMRYYQELVGIQLRY